MELDLDSNFGGDFEVILGIDELQGDLGNHFLEPFNTINTFMNNLEPGTSFANLQQVTQALMNNLEPGTSFTNLQQVTQALMYLFPSMEQYQDETESSESLIINAAEVYIEEDDAAEDEAQEDFQDVKEEGQETSEDSITYGFCRGVLEDDDHEELVEIQCNIAENFHLCLEDSSDVESEQSQGDMILISPQQEVQKKEDNIFDGV